MSSLLGLPKNKNFPLRARSLFLRWPWISGIILYMYTLEEGETWGQQFSCWFHVKRVSNHSWHAEKLYNIVMTRAINWFLLTRIQVEAECNDVSSMHLMTPIIPYLTLSLVLTCLYDYVYKQQRITKPNENNEITKITDLNFQAAKYDIKQHSDAI